MILQAKWNDYFHFNHLLFLYRGYNCMNTS